MARRGYFQSVHVHPQCLIRIEGVAAATLAHLVLPDTHIRGELGWDACPASELLDRLAATPGWSVHWPMRDVVVLVLDAMAETNGDEVEPLQAMALLNLAVETSGARGYGYYLDATVAFETVDFEHVRGSEGYIDAVDDGIDASDVRIRYEERGSWPVEEDEFTA